MQAALEQAQLAAEAGEVPVGAVIARSERVQTLQSFPLASRAGIEAAGVSEEREEPE